MQQQHVLATSNAIMHRAVCCNAIICPLFLSYLNVRHGIDDAAFFDALYERITGSVVGNGETERILRFDDFHLLWSGFFVRKNEIIESDLAAQQFGHVDFVRVKRAEQNLVFGVGASVKMFYLCYVLYVRIIVFNKRFPVSFTHSTSSTIVSVD